MITVTLEDLTKIVRLADLAVRANGLDVAKWTIPFLDDLEARAAAAEAVDQGATAG